MLTSTVLTAFVGVVAFAQSQNVENQALSKALQAQDVSSQPQIEVVNDPIQVPAQTQQSVQTTTVQNPVILQNQPTNSVQQPTFIIQKQPTTVVEDSPLSESSADRLRKQRVEMEQQTESRIVEKLEQERIKAEQERAAKFMDAMEGKKEEPKKEEAPAVIAPVVVAPVAQPEPVVVQPQPVVEQAPVLEAKSELKELDKEEKSSNRMFMGLDAGFVNYSKADNVRVSPGIGFTLGGIFDQKFIVEGSLLYSKGKIENATGAMDPYYGVFYPDMETMDQYGISGTFKYRILEGKFSPIVGASLIYTYRDYKASQCASLWNCQRLEGSSWAIDTGLLVGGDLKLTKNLSIGADFKYVFNVAYDVSTRNGFLEPSQIMYSGYNGDSIESIGYYNFLLHATFSF